MDISYCSSGLLRHSAQSWLIIIFLLLFFIILQLPFTLSTSLSLSLSLSAFKSHNGPGIYAGCSCMYVLSRWMWLSAQYFGPLFVSALSRTQRGMWWWKWIGIVESYLLCGDTASLRGLCHDASAELGQPEGTGRLENTYCICCLALHRRRESKGDWKL